MNKLTTPSRARRLALTLAVAPTLTVAPIGTALAAPAPDASRAVEAVSVRPPRPAIRAYVDPEAASLTKELRAAITATNEDPDVAAGRLRTAIDAATNAPGVVARDQELYNAWIEGMLTLARADLVLDERGKAIVVVDQAIRVSRGAVPPIEEFGPSLTTLYRERVTAPELRAVGQVHVSCTSRCRVILDGNTAAAAGTDSVVSGIPLGAHVIRIEPQAQPSEDFLQESFTLTDASRTADFSYDPPKPSSAPAHVSAPVTKDDPGSGRKVPRWASIVGMSVGALGIAAGAVLIATSGGCIDGSDPNSDARCEDVLDNVPLGTGVLVAGAATLVGFTIVLGVGEVKDKRYKQSQKKGGPNQATLGVRWRF